MAGAKKPPNKTAKKMRRQADDLVLLAALGNGEGGSKEKDQIGSLNKWLETVREGFTNLTPKSNDIPYDGQLPKFTIKTIVGGDTNNTGKTTTKKK